MTDSSVAGLCRLTVRAPATSLDLAVPADVPVADLLPILLRYAGEELEESGLEHGGWVLQRPGGRPLDDEGTLETLDLKDGEVLYLRPHTEALPEVRLDDLVDGIAGVTRDRLHGWTPETSRRLLRTMVVLTVLTALGVLAWPGGPVTARAAAAGVAGLLLLAGAASASRAVGDAAAGATLGFLAAPSLALAGWLLPGGEMSGAHAHHVLGARLLAAGAAGAGGAVLALAAAAVYTPFFLATAVVAITAAVAGALMSVLDVSVDAASAAVAAAVVLFGGFVPALSFRLAGMRMPALPTSPQQLQEGIEPYHGQDVATRTELASGWMTALYGATGVVCAGCLVALARRPSLAEALTAVALSLLLLLHGRGMVNVGQRLTLVVPGTWGVFLLAVQGAAALDTAARPTLVAGLLALAAVLAIVSWTVPGRRMAPYWGRAGELLHSLLAIGLLPLTLWVIGVFGALRAING
ncbi:type VII secretion integral membrane protein EccD [Streptomyces sp. NBC_00268]|uniref:type VII secretion integral membrane protein EccD n=1 Tax=Streptomyces sp. NBC_00268 TaxID=2975695 RepID=UPI002256C870|nr:type VII secretion integral membrane protein EccD [Streptomyces sp. NBC_00268]MCX5182037.1 type VII secretion integral membrane protein EccD [Streptomyces sp. NBC_00268]